jgi:hypothetical protein
MVLVNRITIQFRGASPVPLVTSELVPKLATDLQWRGTITT